MTLSWIWRPCISPQRKVAGWERHELPLVVLLIGPVRCRLILLQEAACPELVFVQEIGEGPPAIGELKQSLSMLSHLLGGSRAMVVGWKIKYISTKHEPKQNLSTKKKEVEILTNSSERIISRRS